MSKMIGHFSSKTLFLFILLIINLIAHFLPFERVAPGPDDFIQMYWAHGRSFSEIFNMALHHPDRPLAQLFILFQANIIGLNAWLGIFLVLISSSLCIWAVFILMTQLLNDLFLAQIATLFYLLLPNKLDLFHTPLYANVNIVTAIYIVSFIFFIHYIKKEKVGFLFLSLLLYILAIFWYEVGFFIPFVYAAYLWLCHPKKIKNVLLFLIPIIFYPCYRLTGIFGLINVGSFERNISNFTHTVRNLLVSVPNHYFGRYMMRAIVYGLYRFPTIEIAWLMLIVVLDGVILAVLLLWLRKKEFKTLDKNLGVLAVVSMFFFLLPNSMYVIESRHTALSSIGFSILFIFFLSFTRNYRRGLITGVFFLFLVISQGTAWNQAIACRINRALYQTILEEKHDIVNAKEVIIDQYSFASHIPYTWGERERNMLDNYWGMQAFAPWGLSAMVYLVTGELKAHAICRSKIMIIDHKVLFRDQNGQQRAIPEERTLIIDYNSVYGSDGQKYDNGNRKTLH